MKKDYSFKIIDTSDPQKSYGVLTLSVDGGGAHWVVDASADSSQGKWRAVGPFPLAEGATDSAYIESLLYNRAPLKWRMEMKRSKSKDPHSFVKLIEDSHLAVASDTYRIVPA